MNSTLAGGKSIQKTAILHFNASARRLLRRVYLAFQRRQYLFRGTINRPIERASGGIFMAAAAQADRNGGDVETAFAAEAEPDASFG